MLNWICIDFGTCNTAAAIEIDGKPHLVSYGNSQYFPTVACVLPDGNIEVCQNAESLRSNVPDGFKQEFKLSIHEHLDLNGVGYADLVREILKFVKKSAEIENNGHKLDAALLTIPAIYTNSDRRIDIMRQAAIEAGFTTVDFMPEPQAAAHHYAYVIGQKSTGISLIYDLGGGTFDASLLEMNALKQAQVLGYECGIKCGGQYFDSALYRHIAKLYQDGTPLLQEKKLDDYVACRRIKEALSVQEQSVQYFSNGQRISIDRAILSLLIKDKLMLTLDACDSLLRTANRTWTDVKQVLLVGGSTAIPLVSELLQKHLTSHNSTSVRIIRNTSGLNGEYNHRFATCLGGLSTKITPPPPPPEPIAKLRVDNQTIQLKEGLNTFGRSEQMDFSFNDPSMSRKHFTIHVTKEATGKWNYTITTCSESKATVLNNSEPLDLRYYPISRKSALLQDGWTITAGKTIFIFKK